MSRHDPLYIQDMSHETKFRGRDIGRPAVKLTFDGEESTEVVSVLNQFEAYNWKKRVSDGHSFLVLRGDYGSRPLSPKNHDGLESFLYNLNPRYCEIQASGYHEPPREIKNYVDSYLVNLNRVEGDRGDTIEFFLRQSRNYDSCDFLIEFETAATTERKVYEWKEDKKVYPHNIHLYLDPNRDNWLDKFEKAQKLAGQNGWNLVPPFEVLYDREKEDEES